MYTLDKKQHDIVKRVQSIAKDKIAVYAQTTDSESRYPSESMKALSQAGFMGLLISSKFGGMEQNIKTMAAVLEEIAKYCTSTALCYLVHLGAAAAYSKAEQVTENLLSSIAKGEHLCSLALAEFGSRSHFWNPLSSAKKENGGITINASKSFVTSAGNVNSYVLITRDNVNSDPSQTTLYYIPADKSGIHVAGSWDALGMRGNTSAPVKFDNVHIPETYALTASGEGLDMLLDTILPIVNIGVSAICLGIAESSINIVKQHIMKTRLKHLSMALADIALERGRLARMRLETDKTRAHLNAVIKSLESGSDNASLMVLESKLAASATAVQVTDIAMKAAGGNAFNKHLGLERRFRDARTAEFIGITSDMLLEFIGKSLCDIPLL